MAKKASFDITTGVDLQEIDNAVNMANKEIATRYDFKGTTCTLEFDRDASAVRLDADDAYRMDALLGVLLARRLDRFDEAKALLERAVDICPELESALRSLKGRLFS